MSTHESWRALLGATKGRSRLMLPGEPDRESPVEAQVAFIAKFTICALRYTWVFEGDPQEGQVLLSHVPEDQSVEAVFWDTWHMGPKFMHMTGNVDAQGVTVVKGHYSVPGNPDWGWQIDIAPADTAGWRMMMHNVSPDGERYPGFEITVEPV
jgi:hypothetical protein